MKRAFVVFALLAAGCAHSEPKSRPEAATANPATATAASANAPSAHPAGVPQTTKSYGWKLLESRCQTCHALPDPRSHSRERWVRGIGMMRGRFTLADADWDSLLALVPADTSAPGSPPRTAAPSPATGR